MLVLSRKLEEEIVIGGIIIVRIARINNGKVFLAIEAPMDVPVHRREVFDAIHSAQNDLNLPLEELPASIA